MDPTRFDALTRAFSGVNNALPSRRRLVGAFAGLLGFGVGVGTEADAKKRRKRRRKKKKKVCLFGQRRCRDKRCHGCCSDADCGGNDCALGTCRDCPRNERLCRGGCIPEGACCSDAECAGGQLCLNGDCACGPGRRLCDGACIRNDECCGDDCPTGLCSAQNCQGCCDGNTCRDGDLENFCGRGGVACVQCGERAICDAGECDCPDGFSKCPNGDCRPANGCCGDSDCEICETCQDQRCVKLCPDGCCHDNICEPGNTLEFCGGDGLICDTCPPDAACTTFDVGTFCVCPGDKEPCGSICCPGDDNCCGIHPSRPCCPPAHGCCPIEAVNACCIVSADCNTLGAPQCVAA